MWKIEGKKTPKHTRLSLWSLANNFLNRIQKAQTIKEMIM